MSFREYKSGEPIAEIVLKNKNNIKAVVEGGTLPIRVSEAELADNSILLNGVPSSAYLKASELPATGDFLVDRFEVSNQVVSHDIITVIKLSTKPSITQLIQLGFFTYYEGKITMLKDVDKMTYVAHLEARGTSVSVIATIPNQPFGASVLIGVIKNGAFLEDSAESNNY